MKSLAELYEVRNQLVARPQAILDQAKAENRDLTEDETKEIDSINNEGGKLDKLDADIKRLELIENRQKEIVRNKVSSQRQSGDHAESKDIVIPRNQKRVSTKFFQGPTAQEDAFTAGQWAAATIYNHKPAQHWLADHGFEVQNSMTEGNNESAAFAVPSVLENAIISHFETFGVVARNVMQKPMVGGSWSGAREREGFTVYYPGIGTAATTSDLKLGLVKLLAKDAVALTTISRNLNADAISALGETITASMARAFASAQDSAAFIGDGTNTYGGVTGLKNALLAGCDYTATSKTTFSQLTSADTNAVIGQLPDWEGMNPKWYMSKYAFHAIAGVLQTEKSNKPNNVADVTERRLHGYDVEFVSSLPKVGTSLTGQRVAYFGDLNYALAMGTAGGMTLESDNSVYFTTRLIALMGLMRFDINVYEIGTASEAGGMIALKMG